MKITWVMVSYGTSNMARRLASELVAQDASVEVVIACNHSADYGELVDASGPFSSIDFSHNPGYLGALREYLASRGTPEGIVVLSNCDLSVQSDALASLRAAVRQYPDAAMLAPTIVGNDGKDQNPHLVRPPRRIKLKALLAMHKYRRIADFVARGRTRGHSARSAREGISGEVIFAGHGSCLVFTQKFFQSEGSLGYPVWLFGEELWCGKEVARIGGRVRYVPEVRMIHHEHATTGHARRNSVVARAKYDALRYWAAQ